MILRALFRHRRPWRLRLCNVQLSQNSYCFLSTSSSKKVLNGHCVTGSPLALFFLQASCGLSLDAATLVCTEIHLKDTERAETVFNLLRDQKFTKPQIAKLISTRPQLLMTDPGKFLEPNFKTFSSVGLIGPNLFTMLLKHPRLFKSKAEVVVQALRRYGFTSDEILTMTRKVPLVYNMRVNKTLHPKVDFFRSLGLTDVELRTFLKCNPYVLLASLERTLVPFVNTLRCLLGDDVKVVNLLKRWRRRCNLKVVKDFESNILALENHGVPVSMALKSLSNNPHQLIMNIDLLNKSANYAKTLDLDPENYNFSLLIYVKSFVSETMWAKKLDTYKSFGLTEENLRSEIRKEPLCMAISVERIKERMNFFVNMLKDKPQGFLKFPKFVLFSMEKRVLPRCSIMDLLGSKNLISTFNLRSVVELSEKDFFEQIVKKYDKDVPEIMKAWNGEIEFQGLYKGYWKNLKYCFENRLDSQSS